MEGFSVCVFSTMLSGVVSNTDKQISAAACGVCIVSAVWQINGHSPFCICRTPFTAKSAGLLARELGNSEITQTSAAKRVKSV